MNTHLPQTTSKTVFFAMSTKADKPEQPEKAGAARAAMRREHPATVSDRTPPQPQQGTTLEELTAANAKLRAANNELRLSNQELSKKVDELSGVARRYQSLFDCIDDGCCVVEIMLDKKGRPFDYRYLEISASFERQSGMTNVVGKTFREVSPEPDPYWVRTFGAVADGGEPVRIQRHVPTTGKWFDIYAFRVGPPGDRRVAMLFSDITVRKKTEAALRESEQRFSDVANAAPVMIWVADTSRKCYWFNKPWLDFTGRLLEQEYGDGWTDGVHPDDLERCRQTYDGAIDAQAEFEIEYRLRRFDGEYRWVLDRGTPLWGENNVFKGYIGSCIDISDRRHAEEELRASKAEIELIFTGTPFMLTHCSRDMRYRYVSRSYAEMLGREPKDFIGVPIVDILGKEALETIRPRVEAVLAGEPVEYEDEVRYAGVGPRYMRVAYVPARAADGSVTGWIASMTDITDRKQAEDLLDRYRVMSEHSRDIIWFSTPDGRFVNVNRAAIETYGYSADEFMAMNIADIRDPSTSRDVAGQLATANRGGLHFETLHRRRDGSSFPVEVTASGADVGGQRLVMSIIRDISARKKYEEKLIESEVRRKLAQDAGNVGIWDWDIKANRTYWSETMWAFYGEKPLEINPDEAFWSAHLHEDDRERVKENIQDVALSGADQFRDEFRIVHRDGSIRWIEAVAKVLRDPRGAALRMLGVNLDITERKNTEERLRLSEDQLRLVTDTVPALISYIDDDERFRFANKKYSEWFNLPADDLVGLRVRDVVGLPAYRTIKPEIDKALTGASCTFETWLDLKNAGTRFVRISFEPDIDAAGMVKGVYGLISDLTELKRSEELLRSTEDRILLMMESLVDYAIFGMDREGRIDSWNKGAELIFGYSQTEILGASYETLLTGDDVARGANLKEMRTARQKGRLSDERWYVKKDGSRFFASGVLMPLYMGKGLIGYAKIASDLTEKKRHAEELQRAHDELELRVEARTRELAESNSALLQEIEERRSGEDQRIYLLRRLVTSQESERRRIARDLHDQLGQRLTALRLKIASLRGITADDQDIGPRVERLQEIAERLDSEVSFLAWELRPSALDDLGLVDAVGTFVTEWSRHYETHADFHAAKISKDRLNPDIETHLYRMTQEALNNVAKHAQATHVTVLLENREDSVILIIEDDGVGFEPVKENVLLESSGGLGLVGMRERASLAGGDIEIESSVGNGTTIYVRIPYIS